MSRPRFERVVIVGLGLLGGSLGLALKKRRLAKRVVALGRELGRLRPAVAAGLADEASNDDACVHAADLIVLCTPFTQFESRLRALSAVAPPGCLCTEVGSVKGPAVRRWHAAAQPLDFVASHPMAGSEKSGWRNARADLFEGAACLLTPLAITKRGAVKRVGELWQALGMKVSLCSPEVHDRIVARVSHLPHAAAAALAVATARTGPGTDMDFAGPGWRDASRIAASDEFLWTDIFLHHPRRMEAGLRELEAALRRLRGLIRAGKAGPLRAFLRRAAEFRRRYPGPKS